VQREIQRLIAELAEQGLGVLDFIGNGRLVEGSQRVVVLTGGQSRNSVASKNTKAILHAMAEGADRGKPSVDSVKQSKTEYE